MASELNPAEQETTKTGETRRGFLIKLGIGAAALGLVASSLSSWRGRGPGNGGPEANRPQLDPANQPVPFDGPADRRAIVVSSP